MDRDLPAPRLRARVEVSERELERLLGYPPESHPEEPTLELAREARAWFAAEARPWIESRVHRVESAVDGVVTLGGGELFQSPVLASRLAAAEADRVVVVGASAGPEVVAEVARLWEADRPDLAFVLDALASATVEELLRRAAVDLCEWAEPRGMAVLPRYSPGYEGWPLSDQSVVLGALFPSGSGETRLRVLDSGLLAPIKSQLSVFGLTSVLESLGILEELCPCVSCSLSDCSYRRAPQRQESDAAAGTPTVTAEVSPAVSATKATPASVPEYAFPRKALERWRREYLDVETTPDGGVAARFRYQGNTCGNMGKEFTIVFEVDLSQGITGHMVEGTRCLPAAKGNGYRATCAALERRGTFLAEVEEERPFVGRPLDDVLSWDPETTPSGCLCARGDRDHKWRIVLQTLHFALRESS